MLIMIDYIISELENYAENKRINFANTSHPTAMRIIGVSNPNQKIILKKVKSKIINFSNREKIELVHNLFETNIFECQHMAFDFIGNNKAMLKELSIMDIEKMNKNLDNWVSVDCYGVYIIGYALREHLISLDYIQNLINSENFWIRRVALVSTVALNMKSRGAKGNPDLTIKICSYFVNDHHNMIIKALSWSLRELIKITPKPVIDFIEKYNEILHPRVIREVTNKLTTGKKN